MSYGHYFHSVSKITDSAWQAIASRLAEATHLVPEYPFGEIEGHPYEGARIKSNIKGGNAVLITTKNGGIVHRTDQGFETIWFNGSTFEGSDHAGDLFCVTHDPTNVLPAALNYCATDRKPYDFLVCVTLILMEHFAPGHHRIESDGGVEDWRPALRLVRDLLPEAVLPVGVDPDRITRKELWDPAALEPKPPLTVFRSDVEPKASSLYF